MKTAKPPVAEPASHRRSQPVRQTRTNPPRTSSSGPGRSLIGRDSLGGGHAPNQPIEIFHATTHFADAITALPRELVRHFTLLKEVEAKIFAPEEALFRLAEAALNAPVAADPRSNNGSSSSVASGPARMSTPNSTSGIVMTNSLQPIPSTDESQSGGAADNSILPRRQLWRQTAFRINELLVSLEEKNHVITTANEALQKELARIEDVWPHLEREYSDEAKWGNVRHWAYPENRAGRAPHTERSRREGAANHTISASAQAIADEAAARSDARKQAVMAKKSLKTQQQESDFDDGDARAKAESGKKPPANSKVRKTLPEAATNVGLGISNTAAVSNGNPPPKRRKVEKAPNGPPAPVDRAMSTVFGNNAPKQKTTSPRETPVPEPKKRKALPNSNGQAKKSRTGVTAISPSVVSSPVMGTFPEAKPPPRSSPAPAAAARPSSSRARQNSTQGNNVETATKARPQPVVAPAKANGSIAGTPDLAAPTGWPKAVPEPRVSKEPNNAVKAEAQKKEPEVAETQSAPPVVSSTTTSKKETVKSEEPERRPEPVPIQTTTITTVTKSGRASKPSTPAMATFQDASARSRSARNSETANALSKKAKKSSSAMPLVTPTAHLAEEDGHSSAPGDEEEAEAEDPNEPTFCYCNRVSFGEMIACDAEGCEKEWFHLSCVGMKVAPKSNIKWYCDNCKERMKTGVKKHNGR